MKIEENNMKNTNLKQKLFWFGIAVLCTLFWNIPMLALHFVVWLEAGLSVFIFGIVWFAGGLCMASHTDNLE